MKLCNIIIILSTFLLSNHSFAQSSPLLLKAIDLFSKRAEGATGLTPKPEIIEEAIGILEKEMLVPSQHKKLVYIIY